MSTSGTLTNRLCLYFEPFFWFDLESKSYQYFRILRTLHLLRIVRLYKELTRENSIVAFMIRFPEIFLGMFLICSGAIISLIVYQTEFSYSSNSGEYILDTYGESLWFSMVTITTVGYGDKYTERVLGRIFGSCSSFSQF
eukprot:snap_masked-scaffold_1-processed-gene-26.24-mRNA-1 protein AED:1.00 eAED:1.00 QI:0/0/0/0/1/1/4/0/139